MKTKNFKAIVTHTEVAWLTTERAQEYLGVSRDFLDNLRQNAKIPFYKVGRTIFFKKDDLDKLITQSRVI